jgi:hypothetical protein
MKKVFVLISALAAAAALTVGVGLAIGSGGPINTAVEGCGVLDANGNVFLTNGTLSVYASGKVTLHCIGQGAGNGSVVTWNNANTGLSCGLYQYGSTNDWNDRVSKSGESQLWCYGSTEPRGQSSSSGGVGG